MDAVTQEAEFKIQNKIILSSLPLITLDRSQQVVTETGIQILLQNPLVEMHLTVFWQWYVTASEI